jgi:hypothetical protein
MLSILFKVILNITLDLLVNRVRVYLHLVASKETEKRKKNNILGVLKALV